MGRNMPISKNRSKAEALARQNDERIAMRVKSVVENFHNSVLCGFIPVTWLKTFVVIILLLLDIPPIRVSVLSGVCVKTVRRKKAALDSGKFLALFARKTGVGRKRKSDPTSDETTDETDPKDEHVSSKS